MSISLKEPLAPQLNPNIWYHILCCYGNSYFPWNLEIARVRLTVLIHFDVLTYMYLMVVRKWSSAEVDHIFVVSLEFPLSLKLCHVTTLVRCSKLNANVKIVKALGWKLVIHRLCATVDWLLLQGVETQMGTGESWKLPSEEGTGYALEHYVSTLHQK